MNLSVEHILLFALVVCAFYYINRVEGLKCPTEKVDTVWGEVGGLGGVVGKSCSSIVQDRPSYTYDSNGKRREITKEEFQEYCDAQYASGILYGHNVCDGEVYATYQGLPIIGEKVWLCQNGTDCDP